MSQIYYWGKPITKDLFQIDHNNLQTIAFDKKISQISCGQKHCVILMDDEAYGFGDNTQGQIGNQPSFSNGVGLIKIHLGNDIKVQQISCGWEHTLILDNLGCVYSAGRGDHGQLGRGKNSKDGNFQIVLKGAKQISAGKDHSLALCNFKVMGWGNSREGQLGLLIKKHYFQPCELNVYPCKFIFAGAKYSFFITSKGVYGTGLNQNCQLGLGHQTNAQIPRKLHIQEQIVSITGGNYCAAKTLSCEWYLWGSGGFGMFKYPTKMSFLKGAEQVSMGLNFGVLSQQGRVWVWGSNRWGQLGIQDQFKDYAYEVENISKIGLNGLQCGGNFMIGYVNQRIQTFNNNQCQFESQCFEQDPGQKDKNGFKKSSDRQYTQNRFKNKSIPNQWSKYYEIPNNHDRIKQNSKKLFAEQSKSEYSQNHNINTIDPVSYNTWQQFENSDKRKIKLMQPLKSLTCSSWHLLERQNESLKERLKNQRFEKERIKRQYIHLMNINEDNKIYSKILQIQNKIYHKEVPKDKDQSLQNFNKKLGSLKLLLESAM